MSKKSRGFQPDKPTGTEGDAASGDVTPAASPSGSSRRSSRAAQRRQQRSRPPRATDTGSSWLNFRNLVIVAIAVIGVGIVGLSIFQGASAAPYECASLLTPAPDTQPPGADADSDASPAPTPLVGFVTDDLGRDHQATGSSIRYAFCPPTSGDHWNIAGRAPLRRDVYGAGDAVGPGNWVHNLEHGYVVIAYQGEPSDTVMAGIREVFDDAVQKEVAAQCGIPNKVIAVPFEDMAEPYALLAWDRALLMPEWDTERALTFANQWQESPQHPEPAC